MQCRLTISAVDSAIGNARKFESKHLQVPVTAFTKLASTRQNYEDICRPNIIINNCSTSS